MNRAIVGGIFVTGLLLLAAAACSARGQALLTVCPAGHPEAATVARPPDLATLRRNNDLSEIRRHGWQVFREMTGQNAAEPAWLHWYDARPLLKEQGKIVEFNKSPRAYPPDQFENLRGIPGDDWSEHATDPGPVRTSAESLSYPRVVTVLFEPMLKDQVVKPGKELWKHSSYGAAPLDFSSPGSIALKAIWWPVSGNLGALTRLPVWDNHVFKPTDHAVYDLPGWQRSVAIDPSHAFPEGTDVADKFPETDKLGKPNSPIKTVSLDRFFCLDLKGKPDLVDGLNKNKRLKESFKERFGRPIDDTDKLALIGLNITKKELPDWTWIALWWSDQPSQKPGQSTNDAFFLRTPWRNYLLDATLGPDADADPGIVFNPYLETAFRGGVQSNCFGCHQFATRGRELMVPDTWVRRRVKDELITPKNTRLDFLWSFSGTRP